tara:strand:+ start:1755 stop:2126 length:372 start_codon:yes stop_codon:yes gene_type:complete
MQERRIKIQVGDVEVTALLNGCATADLVWDALPISSTGSTWGDEIYFRTDLTADEQDSEAVVDMGAVAFWPPGQAICLFYGLTPMSTGDEIRPASPVNVIGQIEGDPTVLKSASGSDVRVERV